MIKAETISEEDSFGGDEKDIVFKYDKMIKIEQRNEYQQIQKFKKYLESKTINKFQPKSGIEEIKKRNDIQEKIGKKNSQKFKTLQGEDYRAHERILF
jgi:Ribonuclease G/E